MLGKVFNSLKTSLEEDHQQIYLWVPVGIGLGVFGYFSLKVEPPLWLGLSALGGLGLFARLRRFRVPGIILMLVALGFTVAQWRTSFLSTPLLHFPVKAQEITGTLAQVERHPGSMRLVLEDLEFSRSRFSRPLRKVRVTLRGSLIPEAPLWPGQRVRLKAVLLPPSEPVAPGSYDFRRRAFFEGIGAVGYGTSRPDLALTLGTQKTWSFWQKGRRKLAAWRYQLTEKLRQTVRGVEGEIAAALVTGDRSGIPKEMREAFADAGIAHVLAISGLHLTVAAGLIFLLFRRGLSLIPPIALRYPIKKWAAALAILFTFGYLLLCNGTLPAQRAFLMASIFLTAILFDRQAMTLRNVAVAATVILLCFPESLMSPSFQLSFAAVVALVAGYEKCARPLTKWCEGEEGTRVLWRRGLVYFLGILTSSLLATFATTPFVLHTFHRFTLHGITANLVTIPLVSFCVIPLLILTLFLMPFGLEGWVAPLLFKSLSFLAGIAVEVSTWPGSVLRVPSPGGIALLAFSFGGLWLCLWRAPWRRWGFLGLGIFPLFLLSSDLPDLYISGDRKVIGYRDSDGTAWVHSKRAGKFARHQWLRSIGVEDARRIMPKSKIPGFRRLSHSYELHNVYGLRLEGENLCLTYKGKTVLQGQEIQNKGGHFLWLDPEGLRVQTVREEIGARPWTLKSKYLWRKKDM